MKQKNGSRCPFWPVSAAIGLCRWPFWPESACFGGRFGRISFRIGVNLAESVRIKKKRKKRSKKKMRRHKKKKKDGRGIKVCNKRI